MAKFKIKDNVFSILFESFKLYFKNIGKFTQYMLFPVFGQIIGIVMVIGFAVLFGTSLPNLTEKYAVFNNASFIFLTMIILTIPGLIIMLKAFWDYMIAYGAINSMTEALITTGKLYDFESHRAVVKQQSYKYIGLLLVISILFLIGINPLFWILGMIFFVYFTLVFQVFIFEKDLSIYGIFKRSLELIKGNFARTFVIMVALYLLSYSFLSFCITAICDITRFTEILKGVFELWAQAMPLNDMNNFITSFKFPAITALEIANMIFSSFITFFVAGLTLPMRSVTWSLWYKNLSSLKEVSNKGKNK